MEAMRTPEQPVGHNRTGIKASPMDGQSLERLASDSPPPPTTESLEATMTRESFTRQADRLGSVPPIATAQGLAETALHALEGHRIGPSEQMRDGARSADYREHLNKDGSFSEVVAENYAWRPGTELADREPRKVA